MKSLSHKSNHFKLNRQAFEKIQTQLVAAVSPLSFNIAQAIDAIEKGAKIEYVDHELSLAEESPLTYLSSSPCHEYHEAMRTLLAFQPDIGLDARDCKGTHVLNACHDDLFADMLDHGADPYAVEQRWGFRNYGRSPVLHEICARGGAEKKIEILARRNVSLDGQDKDGFTPLMAAVAQGCFSTAETLLKHGANTTLETKDGETVITVMKRSPRFSERLFHLLEEAYKLQSVWKGEAVQRYDR